jgi:predicted PurR-regulated permease PerM
VTQPDVAAPKPNPVIAEPAVPAALPDQSLPARGGSSSLAVLAVMSVLAACYVAKLPIIVLLLAVLLAYVLAPVVDVFLHLRIPHSLASAVAVLLFLGITYGLLVVSYNSAVDFSRELPKYSRNIRHVVEQFRYRAKQLQQTTETVLPEDAEERSRPTINVEQRTTVWTLVSGGLGPIWEVAFAASFIPFLAYFMLTWQNHVRSATVMLFPPESRNEAYVTVGLISRMVRGFLVGNLLIGLLIGGLSTGVFAFLHLPYFYFFGLVSGFLSLVPYLGIILAAVPPLFVGLGQLHSSGLIMLVVAVAVLHLFALNVLYPKVLGGRLQLNPLVVTLSLLFWGWMWGAMGLVLAVPITAATKIVFDHVKQLRGYGAWLGE